MAVTTDTLFGRATPTTWLELLDEELPDEEPTLAVLLPPPQAVRTQASAVVSAMKRKNPCGLNMYPPYRFGTAVRAGSKWR